MNVRSAFRFCLANVATLVALLCPLTVMGDEALNPWRTGVKIQPVSETKDRHVIHAYFNTSPESPDGRYVLYYTSAEKNGEKGDLRIVERATGTEKVIAQGVVTEDAHRAACQQWSRGGMTVVYHDVQTGTWQVMAYDLASGEKKVLAKDRQLGFGSAVGKSAPVYGCHWNPGAHRDLELIDTETGETRVAVRVADVVKNYEDWMRKRFASTDVSIFFPVMSPDEKRVFFKIAKPSGGSDFRSSQASVRDGKVVYDLEGSQFIRLIESWGHPSWSPDGKTIFEYGNVSLDPVTGRSKRHAPGCISDHPSVAPDGRLFVTDANVTKRPFGKEGYWAIAVGSMAEDEHVMLTTFDNTKGATTWRKNHPHPAFSADGKRVYYNVNDGPWTRLMVAERE